MANFTVFLEDGSPARGVQVIIDMLGENAYGITDNGGNVKIPVSQDEGKIIVRGRVVYFGSLDINSCYL